jgi:putative endonuclease
MAEHNVLGKAGEHLAAEFLRKKGYTILHRNWVFEKDELDIVCEKDNTLVFVEVKTRSTDYFGYPEDAVDERKREKLLRVVDAYIEDFDVENEIRIDIISVIKTDTIEKIYHIEDAVDPFWDE